jgi:hypothetical protein
MTSFEEAEFRRASRVPIEPLWLGIRFFSFAGSWPNEAVVYAPAMDAAMTRFPSSAFATNLSFLISADSEGGAKRRSAK